MILITGATGYIGRHLVQHFMDEGLPVRCLVPKAQMKRISWEQDQPNSPEVIQGSIIEEDILFRAVTGVHTIIHLESAQWWGNRRDLEQIEVVGTRTLITVARSARVGRLIYLSQLGATPSSAYTLHKIKGQVEEAVRNSGLAYTILRPGIVYGEGDTFINHIAMMMRGNPFFFLMPGGGEVLLHPIHVDDLVTIIAISLEHMACIDNTIEFGGPEYTTFRDLLRTLSRVTGMSRLLIPVPPYILRLLTRIYRLILPRSLMTPQWLDILATNRTAPLGNTFNHFGFHPKRFEDTLLSYLPHQRHLWQLIRNTFRRRPRKT